MTLLTRLIVVAVFLALGAGQAQAYSADYVDIDSVWEFVSEGDSVSGTFDITVDNLEGDDFSAILGGNGQNVADVVGFDPLSENVLDARVSFLFFDLDMTADAAVIDLGEDVLQQVVAGPQLFLLTLETIDVNVAVLASLNATGVLDWTITADPDAVAGENDFTVALARLEAITGDKIPDGGGPPSPMPEPGSSVLLAVGTLLVARGIRRR